MSTARTWLARIRALPLDRPLRVMNVCGGHERVIGLTGLRGVLPEGIRLIAGPGCPVCVCPEESLYRAIQLARRPEVTLVAFGDLLRVPVNGPRAEPRSLEQARAAGADVRALASPLEARRLARAMPERQVVFLVAGFETTLAPVAALLAEGDLPDNLTILLAGRLTWPAVAMLLEDGEAGFDALIAPGHVATVMGPEQWRFVVDRHGLATAIGGFTPESFLAALYSVLRQTLEGRPFLDNCYPQTVRAGGNVLARRQLDRVFQVEDAHWRGIGSIAASGYRLAPAFEHLDAERRFPDDDHRQRQRRGEMPPGCDCAAVVLGRIDPDQCRLFGRACTPDSPIGPCMVSDEGACQIWWKGGVREPRAIPTQDISHEC